MNKKIVALITSAVLLALPAVMLADVAPGNSPNQLNQNVTQVVNLILNFIWPIFVGFAVLMFLIAGFLFLTAQGDPGKVGAARNAVLWGIIGVVVGIVAFSIPFIIRLSLNV